MRSTIEPFFIFSHPKTHPKVSVESVICAGRVLSCTLIFLLPRMHQQYIKIKQCIFFKISFFIIQLSSVRNLRFSRPWSNVFQKFIASFHKHQLTTTQAKENQRNTQQTITASSSRSFFLSPSYIPPRAHRLVIFFFV